PQGGQREARRRDPRPGAGGVDGPEHRGLVHRAPVLVGQQGRHRGRAAAEVVLLAHGGPEARFLQAGHRHRVAAAMRHPQLQRARERRRRPGRQREQRGCERGRAAHAQGPPPKRTLSEVPCWISTFDPLFWITVVRPAECANAPPSIRLSPATTWLAVLPSTVPWTSTATVTWPSPPRSDDSAASSAAGPNASVAAAGAASCAASGGTASAGSGAS